MGIVNEVLKSHSTKHSRFYCEFYIRFKSFRNYYEYWSNTRFIIITWHCIVCKIVATGITNHLQLLWLQVFVIACFVLACYMQPHRWCSLCMVAESPLSGFHCMPYAYKEQQTDAPNQLQKTCIAYNKYTAKTSNVLPTTTAFYNLFTSPKWWQHKYFSNWLTAITEMKPM